MTNPTHFAVALKYDAAQMGAPQVVAKGMNLVAQNIRTLASEHGVPLLEAPPLARALYRHCDMNAQIPGPLFTAVAEVLAYVYQLRQYHSPQGRESGMSLTLPPGPLEVPADMDPGGLVDEAAGSSEAAGMAEEVRR